MGLPASMPIVSCRTSITPSRRRATSATFLARMRCAAALSVVFVQWMLRLPPTSYQAMYHGPVSRRLKRLPLPLPRFDMLLSLSDRLAATFAVAPLLAKDPSIFLSFHRAGGAFWLARRRNHDPTGFRL